MNFMLSRFKCEQRLIEAGWACIGSGGYSTVYAHKKHPDKVIKVGESNDSWPPYIHWAFESGYMGRFAPNVWAIKKFKAFYLAVVEKLEPANFEAYSEFQHAPHKLGPELQQFYNDVCLAGFTGDWSITNFLSRNGTLVLNDPMGSTRGVWPFSAKRKSQNLQPQDENNWRLAYDGNCRNQIRE